MTTVKKEFESSAAWVERLAAALEALAPRVRPSVPYEEVDARGQTHFYSGLVSYEQYRQLARSAEHDLAIRTAFEESHVWLDDDPSDAIAALQAHPVNHQALAKAEDDKAIAFVGPYQQTRVEPKTLAMSLPKLAIKTDARNAARTLHQFLVLGEARKLKAHEISLLGGLKMSGRLEIGEGAFLAPYNDVKAAFGPYEARMPRIPSHLLREGNEISEPDARSEGFTAFVRELTWGPAVISTAEELESTLTTEFRFSIEDESIEDSSFTFQFPKDHEIVRDILAIAAGTHLLARYQYIRVDGWMEDLDPNIKFGWRSSGGWVNDWWRENVLSDDSAETFLEMIHDWRKYQGNRRQLGLAIRRLAASRSRVGRFGTEDRILDTAIALETMYDLRGSEITYKWETRAAYFLGKSAEERMEILHKVKDFYDARSAVVHGPRGRGRRISLEKALTDGFDIARGTLQKLLRNGEVPDWNSLVMSAGDGGQLS